MRHIAVVGAGAAGLSAAWLLSRRYRVTLYEADRRLGGHANTVEVAGATGMVPVDTGFIVFNELTYPNFTALFRHLGVATDASDMSFAVSLDGGRLEYAGADNLGALFAQKRNLVRPRFLGMLRDIVRFYRAAAAADPAAHAHLSLGEYLTAGGYGTALRDDHVLPMAAAIWSSTVNDILEFPCSTFLRFFQNHGLLRVTGRPQWRTVRGGSREYVRRIEAQLAPGTVRAGAKVVSVLRSETGVDLIFADGERQHTDGVVFATHAPQALAALADATDNERRVLGAFRTQENQAVLHRDPTQMPRRKAAWASWNYAGATGRPGSAAISVTYWMNRLQNIPTPDNLFVTLNPVTPVREDLLLGRFAYQHPIFDRAALDAQARLGTIQGACRTWFCGAWQRYGFHEDALVSALAVAADLGVEAPWQEPQTTPVAAAA